MIKTSFTMKVRFILLSCAADLLASIRVTEKDRVLSKNEFVIPCSDFFGCSKDNVEEYSSDGKAVFLRCRSCGLIWKDTNASQKDKAYDDEYFSGHRYDKKLARKLRKADLFMEIAEQYQSPGRFLEIGCSLGYSVMAANRRGWKGKGTDISEFAVKECCEQGLDAEVVSIEELIQRDTRYNAILMKHVLEHFENPHVVLKQCKELLAENGVLIIYVPNSELGRAKRKREKHKFYKYSRNGSEHYVYFNYHNLTRLLEELGYEIKVQNYPIAIKNGSSLGMMGQRLFRRFLSLLKSDQELFVIAQKK
ncbi:class I SAM-dependent methyltransferase [Puteibacter caeruleilacunae]|nr:class I SAM-dependent methyltransferase [Puteibacter caeruleilacunae]